MFAEQSDLEHTDLLNLLFPIPITPWLVRPKENQEKNSTITI